MKMIKLLAILAVLGIGTYVLMGSIYTVSEVEQAIITQFGKPVGAPVTTAGLKFKVPFIQDVNLIDKRSGFKFVLQHNVPISSDKQDYRQQCAFRGPLVIDGTAH